MSDFQRSILKLMAENQLMKAKIEILVDAASSSIEYPDYSERAKNWIKGMKKAKDVKWNEEKMEVVIL